MLVTDVLGVVTTFNDVQHIVQRTTGRELVKRDVNIMDDSGAMVRTTLDSSNLNIFLWMNEMNFFYVSDMCHIVGETS